MSWDRIAHMNRAKDRKAATGGALQKPRIARHHEHAADSWDRLLSVTRAKWDCWAGDAVEGYRFAVFGDQWEGL